MTQHTLPDMNKFREFVKTLFDASMTFHGIRNEMQIVFDNLSKYASVAENAGPPDLQVFSTMEDLLSFFMQQQMPENSLDLTDVTVNSEKMSRFLTSVVIFLQKEMDQYKRLADTLNTATRIEELIFRFRSNTITTDEMRELITITTGEGKGDSLGGFRLTDDHFRQKPKE